MWHDAPFPDKLVAQVRQALAPGGVWLIGDMNNADGVRANIRFNPGAKVGWAISSCLCLACGMSEEGGAGLGTLGLTVSVARRLLAAGGFGDVKVLMEEGIHRWFEVAA